jgi:hypothetical protein
VLEQKKHRRQAAMGRRSKNTCKKCKDVIDVNVKLVASAVHALVCAFMHFPGAMAPLFLVGCRMLMVDSETLAKLTPAGGERDGNTCLLHTGG